MNDSDWPVIISLAGVIAALWEVDIRMRKTQALLKHSWSTVRNHRLEMFLPLIIPQVVRRLQVVSSSPETSKAVRITVGFHSAVCSNLLIWCEKSLIKSVWIWIIGECVRDDLQVQLCSVARLCMPAVRLGYGSQTHYLKMSETCTLSLSFFLSFFIFSLTL